MTHFGTDSEDLHGLLQRVWQRPDDDQAVEQVHLHVNLSSAACGKRNLFPNRREASCVELDDKRRA